MAKQRKCWVCNPKTPKARVCQPCRDAAMDILKRHYPRSYANLLKEAADMRRNRKAAAHG